MASVAMNFGLAVVGGLSANIGLMKLNQMHKGCTNVCTLFQFFFGFGDAMASPRKRKACQQQNCYHDEFSNNNICGLSFVKTLCVELTLTLTPPQVLLDPKARRLTLWQHALFSTMFFVGPYCGNMACNITQSDFYPVFLVSAAGGGGTLRTAQQRGTLSAPPRRKRPA